MQPERRRFFLSWIYACSLAGALFPAPGASAIASPAIRLQKTSDRRDAAALKNVADYYGLKYTAIGPEIFSLSSRWTDLTFAGGSRKMLAKKMLIWLHQPVVVEKKRALLDTADLNKIIDPLLRPDLYLASRGDKIVVLDPGHGGEDPGAAGPKGLQEKEVVLDLARQVRMLLVNAGYRVYITRDADRFISLDDRTKKAAAWKADVFISLHMNASASASVRGRETFVLAAVGQPGSGETGADRAHKISHPGNRTDEANTILGYFLHKELTRGISTGHDRGLKRARFHVLKTAPCPAALVECGFLSNAADEAWFRNDANVAALARDIGKAIQDYLAAVKRAKLLQDEVRE